MIRGKGRDVFDLWFLLSKKVEIDWYLVNLKMSYYNRKTDLKKIIDLIGKMSDQEIQKDLNKFLPLNQRPMIKKMKTLLLEKLNNQV
ncbi:unnamed protein product [marine sediment metagenome]|uniref:Uncharacterized protein n=1 Tax=marine sediment metagenome TaxID=412755 RepID=X1MTU5_9ZZZZ